MNPEPSAPAELRFDCPACHSTLSVPAAAAGVQGPCPKCWQEIIGPDPAKGQPARLPAPAPAPAPLPVSLANEPPPAEEPPAVEELPSPEVPPVEKAPPPAEEPPSVEEAPPFPEEEVAPLDDFLPPEESASAPVREKRRSRIPMLICLLVTAVGFGFLGHYIGQIKKVPADIVEIPDAQIPASPGPPDGTTPKPEPGPVAPPIIPPQTPPPGPGPADPAVANTDLAPEAALRAFLNAADWKRRSIHVLWPDKIRPLMENYAAENGDGPIPYQSIEFTDGDGGNRFFQVFTEDIPDGFPVAVIATDEGPKIEWETFIGFHDDHFRKFIEGPVKKTGAFDLLIWPADPVEEGNAWLYQLRAPIPGRETVAYARKDATASARLTALFNGADGIDKEALKDFAIDGVPIALKLAKRSMTDGTPYIEILEVISVGWISGEP